MSSRNARRSLPQARGGSSAQETSALMNHPFSYYMKANFEGQRVYLQLANGEKLDAIIADYYQRKHSITIHAYNSVTADHDVRQPEALPLEAVQTKPRTVFLSDIDHMRVYKEDDANDSGESLQTDGQIARTNGGSSTTQDLNPWQDEDGDDLLATSAGGLSVESASGWDPEEMFKVNAAKHNVTTDFDPTLSQYTTKLDKTDTPEFRERQRRAARTAELIERGSHSRRIDDTDMTEEEKYSSVPRVAGLPATGNQLPAATAGAKVCSELEAEATAAAVAAASSSPASPAAGTVTTAVTATTAAPSDSSATTSSPLCSGSADSGVRGSGTPRPAAAEVSPRSAGLTGEKADLKDFQKKFHLKTTSPAQTKNESDSSASAPAKAKPGSALNPNAKVFLPTGPPATKKMADALRSAERVISPGVAVASQVAPSSSPSAATAAVSQTRSQQQRAQSSVPVQSAISPHQHGGGGGGANRSFGAQPQQPHRAFPQSGRRVGHHSAEMQSALTLATNFGVPLDGSVGAGVGINTLPGTSPATATIPTGQVAGPPTMHMIQPAAHHLVTSAGAMSHSAYYPPTMVVHQQGPQQAQQAPPPTLVSHVVAQQQQAAQHQMQVGPPQPPQAMMQAGQPLSSPHSHSHGLVSLPSTVPGHPGGIVQGMYQPGQGFAAAQGPPQLYAAGPANLLQAQGGLLTQQPGIAHHQQLQHPGQHQPPQQAFLLQQQPQQQQHHVAGHQQHTTAIGIPMSQGQMVQHHQHQQSPAMGNAGLMQHHFQ